MRMLKVIQSVAGKERTALTQKPLGEFAILFALMVGGHYGLSGLGSSDSSIQPSDIVATQANVVEANVAALALASAPTTIAPKVTQLSMAQVEAMVDQINPSRVLPPAAAMAANAQTHQKLNQADATQNNSMPRFVFAQPNTTPKSTQADQASATSHTTNKPYQFKPSVTLAFNSKAKTNLLDAKTGSANVFAIWDVNKRFSLVTKTSKKTIAAQSRKKNDKFVIMIDPGHGGTDPGSIGHNGLLEKALTLDIAKRTQLFLSEMDNISVVLTRDGDKGMSRKSRVNKVKRSNADMVVSLHLNHLPQTDINLVETFYAAPHNIRESIEKQRSEAFGNGMVKTTDTRNHDLSFTKGSAQLANLMQKRVFDEVAHNNPATDNAGVKQDTLYILTRSFTPGVLIEMSCLSNEREAERLADPAYRDTLAAALADGIRDYLETPEAKRQFGPGV